MSWKNTERKEYWVFYVGSEWIKVRWVKDEAFLSHLGRFGNNARKEYDSQGGVYWSIWRETWPEIADLLNEYGFRPSPDSKTVQVRRSVEVEAKLNTPRIPVLPLPATMLIPEEEDTEEYQYMQMFEHLHQVLEQLQNLTTRLIVRTKK